MRVLTPLNLPPAIFPENLYNLMHYVILRGNMALGNGIESKLWEIADQLRANSRLKSSEYSVPVLGLIFLRYADHKFIYREHNDL